MNTGIYIGVKMFADRLTDEELAAIGMAALLKMPPQEVSGYEKMKSLFTQNGGIEMHDESIAALGVIIQKRLGQEAAL
jgi:hypothetical protein